MKVMRGKVYCWVERAQKVNEGTLLTLECGHTKIHRAQGFAPRETVCEPCTRQRVKVKHA